MSVIQLNQAPKIFNGGFVHRLAEANTALRQLRCLGVKAISIQVAQRNFEYTEIVVNRNPHSTLTSCPGVHVTFVIGQPSTKQLGATT